jgi:hypothetical protein
MSARIRLALLGAVSVGLVWSGTPRWACGQGPAVPEVVPAPSVPEPAPRPPEAYGPVEAGQEAHQRAEAERQAAAAGQRQLNETMRSYAGPGYVSPPAGIYAVTPPFVWGPVGPRRAARYAVQSGWRYSTYVPVPPPLPVRAYRSMFEPWPYVPGDIYGYPWSAWIPQPRGQVQVDIGPGRVLSRPVYDSGQGQIPTPAPPPVAAQPGPGLPESNPSEPPALEPIPTPPVQPEQPGPREF